MKLGGTGITFILKSAHNLRLNALGPDTKVDRLYHNLTTNADILCKYMLVFINYISKLIIYFVHIQVQRTQIMQLLNFPCVHA